jgi:hypothetical protein
VTEQKSTSRTAPQTTIPASSTAFEPRHLAKNPKQFGKSSVDLIGATDVVVSEPKFLAANFQHLVCNSLREALLSNGMTIDQFATELLGTVPGIGYDRLGRVLRGETQIQVADIVAWSQRFTGVKRTVLNARAWGVAGSTDDEI